MDLLAVGVGFAWEGGDHVPPGIIFLYFAHVPSSGAIHMFIRAPKITRVGDGVEVLGRRAGEPVIVRQGRIVATTFHPELARDDRLHRLALGSGEAEDG